MKIGELSRETGVAVRLLRYYEDQGLLTSHRSPGGHRHYGPEAPAAVARIRTLLAAGLRTRVIRELTPCFVGDGTEVQACVLDHLRTQCAELDTWSAPGWVEALKPGRVRGYGTPEKVLR
ncbi:MerR family transcriptional regulator [Actinomadura geliboluensis]|uniref:MerR family transcriptional regulator n=1 Tax=Actinomadura geliboluensis TaxID=882440 RepID=A0A5S4FPS6_9ACTN|nr:MerR family transcriptional regulator [Actinomadura geliboluensis]TMR22191.1 MerR family transcriptional regulator [Actinomadura geliboluensis]